MAKRTLHRIECSVLMLMIYMLSFSEAMPNGAIDLQNVARLTFRSREADEFVFIFELENLCHSGTEN